MAVCNICNNDQFKPGPNGRLSATGHPPVCTKCGSLERHRIHRLIFNRIRDGSFRMRSCLQFSADPAIARGWFERHELSAYGGPNTLDIQKIDRADASYDVVVCNHVVEHVADYRSAIQELVRISKADGFLFLSFPNPHGRAATEDWGYAKPEQHGHYRVFGRDIERTFSEIVPRVHVIAVEDTDPVTAVADTAFVLTGSDYWLARIFERGCRARICQMRGANGARSTPGVPQHRDKSAAPARRASGQRSRYLVSFCNLGRFVSRYSLGVAVDTFDDFRWLDLDEVMDPRRDLGIAGLAVGEAGELYLAVQSSEPRLLQLDSELRPVRSVPLWGAQEPVALSVAGTTVYLASPGRSTLYAIDMAADAGLREVDSLKNEAGAPIHPTGIAANPSGLFVCGLAAGAADTGQAGGLLVEAHSGRALMSDLHDPHSVAIHDGVVNVLSSGSGEYCRRGDDGRARRHAIGGYLRGLCVEDERILIGRSTGRAAARVPASPSAPTAANPQDLWLQRSAILVISPATRAMEAIDVTLFGSEIFDIVKLPDGVVPARTFADPVHRRMAALREAQHRLAEELAAAPQMIGFSDSP